MGLGCGMQSEFATSTIVAAVYASEQKEITGKLDANAAVHNLNNNSVEIGADAEVINAEIYATHSTATSAYTLNNDVTIAGKVTNSDIYGGTGADSLVDVQAGSRLTYSESTDPDHYIISDNVDLGGVISVGQHDTLHIQGYANDGNVKTDAKYNTNLTNIKSTAELYNHGTVELFGDTTVAEGAKLHALVNGATIKVNGDKGGNTIADDVNSTELKQAMVGGRGQLTIAKAQLQSYLTAGDSYTLDNTSGTDKAGNVNITSGGVLEFSDAAVDLSTLDYVTSTDADTAVGKVIVDNAGGTSILKGDAVTVSHALVSDYAAASKLDFSKADDYTKFKDLAISASGVAIEANDLFLGSSRITGEQAADIKFNKATAKDSINFTVGEGTFQLSSTVAGNNYMRTNDLKSDLDFFTALDGKVNGDVDVVSGGKLSIEYGHWTANGDIKLVADTATASTLEVGINNSTNTTERNHIDLTGSDAKLPDATLVLDQALTVDLATASGEAKISVLGDATAGGYTYKTENGEQSNRLGVYDEEFAQNTVGDDHYVMLDLRNGLEVVGDTNAQGQLKGKLTLTADSGGVVKMMADDLNALLVQNNAKGNDLKSGSHITISGKAHLQVTGDVLASFRDFGKADSSNGIELNNGVMTANSLSLIHNHDSGAATDDATYIATNKIDFGSESGTVAVNEVIINDLQRVEKAENSGSDNSYASKVTLAQGTLDIAENLSSLNDTLALGDTATKAHLNFYGADIDPSVSGGTTGNINVDTIEVVNGSVDIENGAWVGNNFILGASGDMTVGGDEDELANLTAQSVTMAAGSLLDVSATGKMSVNSVDFSALTAATHKGVNAAADNTGVHVAGTLIINGDSSAEKGGVKFGADGSIDIAKNGVLKFGSGATTGAILANNTYSGADSIKLDEGYHKIANNGGELHLAFADNTVFDANAIKELKRDLFTSDSFEDYANSTQLADGGILNIGDASFKGVETSDFKSLTAPGTSGYTIAWDDVRDFSDIYGNDVTNNKLSNVNVNSIVEGEHKIQGQWGSLSMKDGVGASAQVTIAGNTSLRNAAGNNGLFISDAAHQQALGAIVESQKDLELIGGGQVGKITLDVGNYDAEKNWTVLEVRDGATTIAAIDAKNTAQIADATVVNLYSDTTVTGDINNIDVVEAYQGAQVKAANAKVNEISTQNADIAIAGDLTFQEAFVFGGSLSAENADMDALGGNEMAVINGGRFDAKTFKGNEDATIRVGLDTSSLPGC